MAEAEATKFSKDDQAALQHLSDLLHLFHHRNRNQHRRSIWWRHFSVFRKQSNLLLEDIKKLNEVPRTHLERSRKKTHDKQIQTRITERLEFWQNVLVAKWQSSFSQIIADGRFASLGLVLVAILAQVCQITAITTALDDLGQVEVEKVINKFGQEDWQADLEHDDEHAQRDEDVGVAILRDSQALEDVRDESLTLTTAESASKSEHKRKTLKSEPKAKKRRKNGNAIDDLFSGLE